MKKVKKWKYCRFFEEIEWICDFLFKKNLKKNLLIFQIFFDRYLFKYFLTVIFSKLFWSPSILHSKSALSSIMNDHIYTNVHLTCSQLPRNRKNNFIPFCAPQLFISLCFYFFFLSKYVKLVSSDIKIRKMNIMGRDLLSKLCLYFEMY